MQSNGNDIDFADNDKAIFGAGNDLEIHHRSSDSDSVIMHQNENGHLRLLSGVNGNGGIKINNRTDSAAYIHCNNEGSVDLYHNGSKKFETYANGCTVTGNLNASNVDLADNAKARFGGSNDLQIYHDGTHNYLNFVNGALIFTDNGTNRAYFHATDGHFLPWTNNTYDLGSTSNRWRNIYTNDLNLSNEGHSNDVDGTWGSYTIQEGAEDLFLINKRNGKKYKFNLTEVS